MGDVNKSVCIALNQGCQDRFGDRSKNAQELIMIHWREIDANNLEGRDALRKAIVDGNEDLIDYLVRNGADVNDVDGNGTSAETLAKRHGNDTAAQIIIQGSYHRAAKLSRDINLRYHYDVHCDIKRLVEREDGITPLMEAVREGHFEIAEYLVKEGADVSARDDRGRMAKDFIEDGLTSAKSRIERVLGKK